MSIQDKIWKLCGLADDPAKGYAQITIDFFQDFEDEFLSDDRDFDSEPIECNEIGSWQYEISCLLDIFNPKFEKDIELFQDMYNLLQSWHDEIETDNKRLKK